MAVQVKNRSAAPAIPGAGKFHDTTMQLFLAKQESTQWAIFQPWQPAQGTRQACLWYQGVGDDPGLTPAKQHDLAGPHALTQEVGGKDTDQMRHRIRLPALFHNMNTEVTCTCLDQPLGQ